MKKLLLVLNTFLLLSTFASAQSLTITQSFQYIPNSSVLASYKNQFGSWEKADGFPYALFRVGLEGNAHEVIAAKQLLHLDLGELGTEVSVYKAMQNELLFLVPMAARTIYLTCGAECTQQLIWDGSVPLQRNTIYLGRVHYKPKAIVAKTTESAETVMRQFFKFRLNPVNAIVSVNVNGVWETWTSNNNVAYKMLNHGSYDYRVTAEGYEPQEGQITVSDESRELHIELQSTTAVADSTSVSPQN